MTTMTYVEGTFTALHAPFESALHGHDWFVRAAFVNDGQPIHYRSRQARLDSFLAGLDHGDLTKLLRGRDTNEGVAEWLGRRLRDDGCVEVDIYRFEKSRRFGAIWKA